MPQLRETRLGALRCIELVLVTLVSGYSVIFTATMVPVVDYPWCDDACMDTIINDKKHREDIVYIMGSKTKPSE